MSSAAALLSAAAAVTVATASAETSSYKFAVETIPETAWIMRNATDPTEQMG